MTCYSNPTPTTETPAILTAKEANAHADVVPTLLMVILNRIERIETRLALSVEKESYTVEEAAERLDRKPWTVRQWCNKGQVQGAKKVHGKGRTGEWRIPHEELLRLQNDGPLPEGAYQAA